MSTRLAPLTTGALKGLAERVLGAAIEEISAPGGRDRQSLRLHLTDERTVIATRRATALRAEHEAGFLAALGKIGAPVPKVLGFEDGVLFQEDLGRRRLSHVLASGDATQRVVVAREAIASLEDIRARVEATPDLMGKLPVMGGTESWREQFAARPMFLSRTLGISPPKVDLDAMTEALDRPPAHFARWDARAGNATLAEDGRVFWFDWEVFGRRAGFEDLGWLVADDFWLIEPKVSAAMIHDIERMQGTEARAEFARFVVLICAMRLQLIAGKLAQSGWGDQDRILREDRVGADPDIITRVATQGRFWAARCADIRPFEAWFGAVEEAMLVRTPHPV